jgi:hypothetical protein
MDRGTLKLKLGELLISGLRLRISRQRHCRRPADLRRGLGLDSIDALRRWC